MFALSGEDLQGRILGCADGPASFNAEASQRGYRVVSCDPLYHFDRQQIEQRIAATFAQVMEQTRQNRDQFVWEAFRSLDDLGRARQQAMQAFLADYKQGRHEQRYVAAELPALPLASGSFDLALCSHFLFLYSEQRDEAFHRQAILEMVRVAREVRIFPLLALAGTRSPHVDPVKELLHQASLEVSIEPVDYEFQRGGKQMLRVRTRPAG
jgi:hypothetical protein